MLNTFRDNNLLLLFPDLRIQVKRLVYVRPFVRWVRTLVPAFKGDVLDLPLSDLEFKYLHPEAALEQGRITELEYKKIKKYEFT